MRPGVLARMTLGAMRHRLTGRRAPYFVTLEVTTRCDALCRMCAIPHRERDEPSFEVLSRRIDELAQAGAQGLCLTGGEPLVRDDILDLVARCNHLGLWTCMETNGRRYPELAAGLDRAGLDHLIVSLDGDEAAHDRNHEPGAYQAAVRALEETARRRVEASTATVLTKYSLDSVGHVLDLAEAAGAVANFHLLHHNQRLDGGRSAQVAPCPAALRRTLRELLEAKRQGRAVGASEKTLRYLLTWKHYDQPTTVVRKEDFRCLAGETHVFVSAKGQVHACRQELGLEEGSNGDQLGMGTAFDEVPRPDCQACASAGLAEQNYLQRLDAAALLDRAALLSGWGLPSRKARPLDRG